MTDPFVCERISGFPVLLFRLRAAQCDQIEAWANALISRLGCRLIEREQGADRLAWVLEMEGRHLLLQFELYSASAWLEPLRAADEALLDRLHRRLVKNSCARE